MPGVVVALVQTVCDCGAVEKPRVQGALTYDATGCRWHLAGTDGEAKVSWLGRTLGGAVVSK